MRIEPAVRISSITKKFMGRKGKNVPALENLSLDVNAREITAIVGPTGCGKTTLLRILSGLESPDEGEVRFSPMGGLTDPRFGYVSQEHSLFPWLSVRRNIELPLRVRGISQDDATKTSLEMARIVGLAEYLDLYPHEISGGMRHRTAIARLLTTEASLWLMDEPFASVDEKTRHSLQDLLFATHKERGCSIVLVTHALDEAVYLADVVHVLSSNPGHVVASVSITETRPRNRLSEEFGNHVERLRRSIERILV